MKKTTFSLMIIFLVLACQKETLHEADHESSQARYHSENLQTPDAVLSFLANEMPERYDPTEVSRIKNLLADQNAPEDFRRSNNTVELPAGSENGLQAAVDEAGPGGTVLVKAGAHLETGLVTVSHRINLVGENGAVLNFDNPLILDLLVAINSGLYLNGAHRSTISNIHFTPTDGEAGSALVVENSNQVTIRNNKFTNYQYSISIEKSDRNSISQNEIAASTMWLADPNIPGSLGITVINGKSTAVVENSASGCQFGIWACDKGGVSWGNTTDANFYGQILCKVPEASITTPSGVLTGSDSPGNHWLVALNSASNNFYAGYVVIDGANKNTLLANSGSGNMAYDIDLVGDSERFGFLTPTSVKNRVYASSNQIIKDCGEKNKVIGGTLVNIEDDPCQ